MGTKGFCLLSISKKGQKINSILVQVSLKEFYTEEDPGNNRKFKIWNQLLYYYFFNSENEICSAH